MPRSRSPRNARQGQRWIRETAVFGGFLGAFVVVVLLAVAVLVQRLLDLPPRLTPRGHILAGAALYPLFLVVVWKHIARGSSWWLAALTLVALLTPGVIFWGHIPPAYALVLGGVSLLPLTVLYARFHHSDHPAAIWVGVLTLSFANVVFVSGIFLGVFPPEAMSGDLFGRRHTTLVHTVLGLATAVLVVVHSLSTYYGRRGSDAVRRVRFVLPFTIAAIALVAVAVQTSREDLGQVVYGPREAGLPGGERVVAAGEIAPGDPGRGVAPDRFVSPESCGNEACHLHIYEQWLVSGHRFAASNRAYTKVVALLEAEEGPAATHFCARCHSPVVAMMGESENSDAAAVRKATELGVTCQYCHIITATHPEKGNGLVDVTFERRFRPEFGLERFVPTREGAAASFIAEGLVAHNSDYKRKSYFASEFCAGCHRIVMPSEMTGGPALVQEDLYTPWLHSSSADMDVQCASCHMQLHVFEDRVHARPDHRMFGTIREMTRLVPPELETQGRLAAFDTEAARWAAGELPVSVYEQAYLASIGSKKSLAHSEFLNGRRAMDVNLAAAPGGDAVAGGTLEVVVTTHNNTGAHPLPSGPLSLNELWLELTATDSTGRRIFESGTLDARGRVAEGAHRLGGTPVDLEGRPIEKHRIWKAVAVVDERLLEPDGTVEDRYAIPVPADARGPIKVNARWRYRRYNADIAEWVFGDEWTRLPVHTVQEAEHSFTLGALDDEARSGNPAG